MENKKIAIQKCTKEEQDIVLQRILKLSKTETRDKFIKNIIEKIINQNIGGNESK